MDGRTDEHTDVRMGRRIEQIILNSIDSIRRIGELESNELL